MFIHISETLEMTSCSFLNLITALVHQLSGISWETRKLLIYTENCLPFALSQLSIFQHSSKKVTVFLKINDYLAKMHIFSSSYLLSNSSEEICFFFLPGIYCEIVKCFIYKIEIMTKSSLFYCIVNESSY